MSGRPLVPSRLALKLPFRPPPKALVCKAMILALVVAGLTVLGAGQALATTCAAAIRPPPIQTLDSDLVNCPNNGIVIGADNITLDLNGHTIDGDAAVVDPCAGFCDNGVDNTASHSGVTIQGGSIRNSPAASFVLLHQRYGTYRVSSNLFVGIVVGETRRNAIEQSSMIDNGLVGMVLFASRDNRSSGTGYQATAEAAWRLTTPATTASTTTPSPTMPRSGWSMRRREPGEPQPGAAKR